jgi:dihydrofolate reductase
MRKIILQVAVSLDSRIEGPNGEIDWCFMDQDYGMNDFLKQVDTLFIGRKTYELMLRMSEKSSVEFPKFRQYIFSTTLNEVKGDSVLIKDNIQSQVEKIKNENGKDIWLFGGGGLTTSLMNLKLVDELWLAVHPVILGGGKPLFNIQQRVNLKLFDTKTYSTGLLFLKYAIE